MILFLGQRHKLCTSLETMLSQYFLFDRRDNQLFVMNTSYTKIKAIYSGIIHLV